MASRNWEPDAAVASGSALVGLHFHLECYVGPYYTTSPSPFEGWATFAQIFGKRPDGFRFAVARMVPLTVTEKHAKHIVKTGAPAGDWLVWDMLTDDLVKGRRLTQRGLLPAPLPLWQGEHLDGLVMKAMALYDTQGS